MNLGIEKVHDAKINYWIAFNLHAIHTSQRRTNNESWYCRKILDTKINYLVAFNLHAYNAYPVQISYLVIPRKSAGK